MSIKFSKYFKLKSLRWQFQCLYNLIYKSSDFQNKKQIHKCEFHIKSIKIENIFMFSLNKMSNID